MRYEPAVGSFARFTLEEVEIDGWIVPRNRVLSLSTLAAMRDRALFFGGDITVSSEPGRGTTVTARMPVAEVAG